MMMHLHARRRPRGRRKEHGWRRPVHVVRGHVMSKWSKTWRRRWWWWLLLLLQLLLLFHIRTGKRARLMSKGPERHSSVVHGLWSGYSSSGGLAVDGRQVDHWQGWGLGLLGCQRRRRIGLGRFDTQHDSRVMRAIAGFALNVDGALHGAETGLGIKGHPCVETT